MSKEASHRKYRKIQKRFVWEESGVNSSWMSEGYSLISANRVLYL